MQLFLEKHRRAVMQTITVLFWFALYVYVPYQTPYLTLLGVASSFIGIILGAYGFSQMIIRIPLGIGADRKGRHKPFIILGNLCAAAASVLRFCWPSAASFLLANLISGMAASTWISSTVLYPTYYPKEQLKKAMGTLLAMNNFGTLMGFLAGMIATQFFKTEILFLLSAGAGSLSAILSLLVWEGPQKQARTLPPLSEHFRVFKRKRLLLFSVGMALLQAVNMSTAMSFTSEYGRQIGADSLQIGLLSALYMGASVLSSFYTGTRHAARLGERKLVPIFFLIYAVCCGSIPLIRQVPLLCLAQILGGFSFASLLSLFMSGAVEGVPQEKRSTAMGFFQAVYGIGMAFGPTLMGVMVQRAGMQMAYWAMAALCAVDGIAVCWLLSKKSFACGQ